MTHLPYIAASYGLTIAVIVTLGILARRRLILAQRRLAAVDPRMGAGS